MAQISIWYVNEEYGKDSSLTVNLPADFSLKDVIEVYNIALEMMSFPTRVEEKQEGD